MPPLSALDAEQFRPIRVLILDVDGVLTKGAIEYTSGGEEIKRFHVRDGSGIHYWHRAGYRSAFLSGRACPAVIRRAEELGVHAVIQDAHDKLPPFLDLLSRFGVSEKECAYVGDDLPDLPILHRVGLGIAVADAVREVKEIAHGVTERSGGEGAVREVIEAILRAQGLWETILARYRG